jgi:hypothetical protein
MVERIIEELLILSNKVDCALHLLRVTFSLEPDEDFVTFTCASDNSVQTCLNSRDDQLDEL